jgi:hypothetical protein
MSTTDYLILGAVAGLVIVVLVVAYAKLPKKLKAESLEDALRRLNGLKDVDGPEKPDK